MNQTEIEAAILETADQLEDATRELGSVTEAAARAEADYKRTYAILMLQAEGGTVAEREHRATMQAADNHMAYKLAEARARSQQEICRTLRARLDAYRTVSANVRSQT